MPGLAVPLRHDIKFQQAAKGRRFIGAVQTIATSLAAAGVTGSTSYSATTPTFLLSQSAAANRLVVNSIALVQLGTVAGGDISVVVAIDTRNRYSAGGTIITPQNVYADSGVLTGSRAATAVLRSSPTATAEDAATVRFIETHLMSPSVPSRLTFDFGDGLVIGATGSLLIYTWAATTGPTWRPIIEWSEPEVGQ